MTHADDEWFADDEFWKLTYAHMFPASRIDSAMTEVDQLLALADVDRGNVLDLACGPGRHSVLLARRGFAVTGVDKSAFLLDRARERAAESGADVEWIKEDMRTFRRPGTFDLVICLFTSFGFFEDDADNQRVLANAAANLRAGGTFVLDMMGKEQIARLFNPTSSSEHPEGLSIHRRRIVDDWTRIQNEWILVHDGRARRLHFKHWIYSAREIMQMARDAGFADVAVFGSLAGDSYGTDANRLVLVART